MGRRYYRRRYYRRRYSWGIPTYRRRRYYRKYRAPLIDADDLLAVFSAIGGMFAFIYTCFKKLFYGISKLKSKANAKYTAFAEAHSLAIRNLQEINQKYCFHNIPNFDLSNSYDNEKFYTTISPLDYIAYFLTEKSDDVLSAIVKAEENAMNFQEYSKEILKIKKFAEYDTNDIPKNQKKILDAEIELFDKYIQTPIIEFSINVIIIHTSLKGRYRRSKKELFLSNRIKDIVARLNNKHNGFYADREMWDSICRVERGKVSNKIRFFVYKRDGYRCTKCGSFAELEIDHIFPISKGGKSNLNNLQTLCHSCNVAKSNTVETISNNAVETASKSYQLLCPHCQVNLILKNGRYGKFFACPNYPKCKYTQKI